MDPKKILCVYSWQDSGYLSGDVSFFSKYKVGGKKEIKLNKICESWLDPGSKKFSYIRHFGVNVAIKYGPYIRCLWKYSFSLRWDNHTMLIRRMYLFSGDTCWGLRAKGCVSNLPLNNSENDIYLHGEEERPRVSNRHPKLQFPVCLKFFITKIWGGGGKQQPRG